MTRLTLGPDSHTYSNPAVTKVTLGEIAAFFVTTIIVSSVSGGNWRHGFRTTSE